MSRRFARAQAGRSLGRDARPSRMKVKGPQTIPSGGYSMRRFEIRDRGGSAVQCHCEIAKRVRGVRGPVVHRLRPEHRASSRIVHSVIDRARDENRNRPSG